MAEPMLAVGIDPAKRQHQAVAVLYPDEVVLDTALRNDVPDIQALDARVATLAHDCGARLVYGIEDHRGLGRRAVEVLQRRGREVRVVNPAWTHRQKEFYGEDKSDSIDARALAAVVLRRNRHLPNATDHSELLTALREAERHLEDIAKQRTKALSRLHGHLGDAYPPAYERFFSKLKSPWALRFFATFPLPQDLDGHDVATLAGALDEIAGNRIGPLRGQTRNQRLRARAETILETTAGVRSMPRTAAMELKAELIRQLCQELLRLHERGQRLERLTREELLPPLEQPLTTIPGVGDILAATIIGEAGEIRRFKDRNAFAKYNGTAPAQSSSGGRQRHRARRGCNHRLKRAFWLAARAAVLHDDLAREYYERCLGRGLTKIDSLKRVARRMSDIVYALLKRGELYDRSKLVSGEAASQSLEGPGIGGTASMGRKAPSRAAGLAESRQDDPMPQPPAGQQHPAPAVSLHRPQITGSAHRTERPLHAPPPQDRGD